MKVCLIEVLIIRI